MSRYLKTSKDEEILIKLVTV